MTDRSSRRIHVIHAISDTNIGGAGIHLCRLLAETDRALFSPEVIVPKNSCLIPRLRALDIPIFPIAHGADRSADPHAVLPVLKILKQRKPDILHTHSALYARLAALLCPPLACVSTRHCADTRGRPSPFHRLGNRLFLGNAVIATADYVKDILLSEGVSPKKIHIIQNGSPSLPRLLPSQKSRLRQSWGIAPEELVVGIVARLEPIKGHEVFLEAAKICLEKTSDIRFLVVGDGSRAAELRSLSHKMGLGDRMIFTGFCPDITPIMNLLDINVNCSLHSETSSLSLSEGMSVGTVPVVSDCGGNSFMTGHGTCGIVYPVGDAVTLAKNILALAENRAQLALFSQRSRVRFESHFTAQAMTRKTEALYLSLFRQSHNHRLSRWLAQPYKGMLLAGLKAH